MSRIVHTSLDVRGCLLNATDAQLRGMFKQDDGRTMTAQEVKLALMDELAKGRNVLPVGGPCEGFDYINGGCPGHDSAACTGIAARWCPIHGDCTSDPLEDRDDIEKPWYSDHCSEHDCPLHGAGSEHAEDVTLRRPRANSEEK